jgi:hypothetical protein
VSRCAPRSLFLIFRHSHLTSEAPLNACATEGSSSGTSAGDSRYLVPTRLSSISAQSPSIQPFAPVPRTHEEPELEWEGSRLPVAVAQNDQNIHSNHPVLSHLNPRRGSTKGGQEIYLIVRNLPPAVILYARFGPNITPTVSSLVPQNAMYVLTPRL